jgi:hypothetical protein
MSATESSTKKHMEITKLVDKAFVISLSDQTKKLDSFFAHCAKEEVGEVEVFRAVDGRRFTKPQWWGVGSRSFSCMMSHAFLLARAISDGCESVAVFEDDAVLCENFSERLYDVAQELDTKTDYQLYLGGQHKITPNKINGKDLIVDARSVVRTHAYILKGKALGRVAQHILHFPDYVRMSEDGSKKKGSHWFPQVDAQLADGHRRRLWETYAVKDWMVGQAEGVSSITLQNNSERWWK